MSDQTTPPLSELKFRKKPVVVEAWLFDGSYESYSHVPSGGLARWFSEGRSGRPPCVEIQTLEGTMTAMPGDWIIRGIKGEFYPCKPDVFAITYEPAAASATRAQGWQEQLIGRIQQEIQRNKIDDYDPTPTSSTEREAVSYERGRTSAQREIFAVIRRQSIGAEVDGLRAFVVHKANCRGIYEPEHVCGLMGYNPMIDEPCPGCRGPQRRVGCTCGLDKLFPAPPGSGE